MTRKDYLSLFIAGLVVLLLVASLQHSPGYMDAEYYLLTGQQVAAGRGFSEPVLWNYLDAPAGLPHPSHTYWMPLPSLAVAASTTVFGASFNGGRVLLLVLAALLPPLAAALSMQLTGRRGSARLAGWLAVLPGFYLPFLTTTDSFALCMLLGGLFFLLILRPASTWQPVALGVLAGLLHLARAEGPLWLLLAGFVAWPASGWRGSLKMLAGYAVIMLPWFVRNWLAFGSLLAPGAAQTLWLLQYDELFSYPASMLTFERWWASGLRAILSARLAALGQNLASALAVGGLVALAPLVVWGAWRLRTQLAVRVGVVAWLALLFAFSIVFPFSGARGGFFHAAAALQPLVWVLAAAGLHAALEWGSARRGWELTKAGHIFSIGILLLAAALSVYAVQQRIVAGGWDMAAAHNAAISQQLTELGIAADEVIMVNNPPGFSLASGRPAIVIPHGGTQPAGEVARQLGASILLLEAEQPGWSEIYQAGPLLSSLQYLGEVDGTRIFRFP